MTLKDDVQAAKAARIAAKSQRASTPADHAAIGARLETLEQTIESLKAAARGIPEESSLERRDLAVEISDSLGVRGGTLRDLGRYSEAAAAYGEGREWELEAERLGGLPNSYCLVQRLVNLFLADPRRLLEIAPGVGASLADELRTARREIVHQMEETPRGQDPWAQADIAVLDELLRDERAPDSWDKLASLAPQRNVYDSTAAALDPLLAVLRRHETEDHADADRELLEWLRAKAGVDRPAP